MGHADAVDQAHEEGMNRLAEEFGRFLAHLWIEGKLPAEPDSAQVEAPAQKATPKRRKRRKAAALPAPATDSRRYLLPEFDIHARIPSGRGKKRPSKKLEQHHHPLWPGNAEEVGELGTRES
jgi:hypothetical protein